MNNDLKTGIDVALVFCFGPIAYIFQELIAIKLKLINGYWLMKLETILNRRCYFDKYARYFQKEIKSLTTYSAVQDQQLQEIYW
ncbi:hypothetical protein EA772_14235 [Pedobacter sp. G11]|uniref:hypothetical protein n=1 Tax=Pedobacter sp. G11 TaxID=2482728 RepID=UPI000F5D72DF|nr:hypothetical protein [Pedobacter sp. G11]AZI26437.1 hypothetical protein EA772_14235 [Pedobacter sp. G11]